jgi:hypothetical protein
VICNHDNRLVLLFVFVEFVGMKATKLYSNSIRRLLLVVPMTCSLAFAACSDIGGVPGAHANVNLRSAAVGKHQTGDYVTIGPRTYNAESRSFERPWPFGPEANPQ